MKIVFLSNYLSIHQLPLCQYLYEVNGEDFHFVATSKISSARIDFGYPDLNEAYPFVIRAYEPWQRKRILQLTREADFVVHGSAPWEYLQQRLADGKLTFLYSERIYKTGYKWWKWPVRLVRFYKKYGRHKNLHLLCSSGYTAGDFARTGTFIKKAYKWGYFPEVKRYDDVEALLDKKQPATLLWVGRFLVLKHPEAVLKVARKLKAEGYQFQVKMLGSGPLQKAIEQKICDWNLQDCIRLLGTVPSDEVRAYMEDAAVYLFTSDRNEGWGAVLNESMNSACAVVASDAIGATPFLLKNGENGFVYHSGDVDELYEKVKALLDNPESGRQLGRKAYETIAGLWNAEVAGARLMELARALSKGEKLPGMYPDGPCSEAKRIKG